MKNFGEITLMGCPNLLHREIVSKEEMSAILARQGVVLKIDKDKRYENKNSSKTQKREKIR